jgi:hypothetical protein
VPKHTLLRPLLNAAESGATSVGDHAAISRALAVDPALRYRASCNDEGVVVLSDLDGRAPESAKEKARWELHVRLRLETELGEDVAASVRTRWVDPQPHHTEV